MWLHHSQNYVIFTFPLFSDPYYGLLSNGRLKDILQGWLVNISALQKVQG